MADEKESDPSVEKESDPGVKKESDPGVEKESDIGVEDGDILSKYNEDDSPKKVDNGGKRRIKLFILLPIVVVAISVLIYAIYAEYDVTDINDGSIIANNVFDLFEKYDGNKDGFLSPFEFQNAYYEMQSGAEMHLGEIREREEQNFHANVTEILQNQIFSDDEEVLRLKTSFIPMDLNTMMKTKEEDIFSDPSSSFHLHGLMNWLTPNIDSAYFPVANFIAFLPPSGVSINPGSTWQIIPKVLARSGSEGKHLGSNRYAPPHPENQKETLLLYLLSMIHKRPFLHMRFPPRGAVACLRAVSEGYYFIMFRLHPEFQLNEPPHYPFWFTPASFIGEIIIKKDGSHIEYFKMYLPTHKQLNIDMEWITGKADINNDQNGEVDIGFVEEMKIESSHHSSTFNNSANGKYQEESIKWNQVLSEEKVLSVLEREFYPFKKVPYLPFNETFDIAKKEEKLVHHIVLWGSLDDQSC